MRKIQFIDNEIYHIYNRGVEKRNIFLDNQDRFRFIHDLFEFNNKLSIPNSYYFYSKENSFEAEPRKIKQQIRKPRKLLVEILAFILMPNHYHLLLRQKEKGGITKFMQKLGTGITMYFNKKYDRTGHLFQGKFKAINVNKEEYLVYLLYYIHFNCLDLIDSGWRKGKIRNYQKVTDSLSSYRWSSHLDYTGKKNLPSITQRDFLLNILNGEKKYKEGVENWLKEISERKILEFEKIMLEKI
ncbi:MAG: transposase [Minisyncoccales bacterium]